MNTITLLEPGTHIAGVVVEQILGRRASNGACRALRAVLPRQQASTLYRVRCAVCGAGMSPISHQRLQTLDAEMDVVNCVACQRRGRKAA
jgi:hypothetical protein